MGSSSGLGSVADIQAGLTTSVAVFNSPLSLAIFNSVNGNILFSAAFISWPNGAIGFRGVELDSLGNAFIVYTTSASQVFVSKISSDLT